MKETILVAQDDKKARGTLVVTLKHSYDVMAVDDGIEAWEVFTAADVGFHLIITDLVLPGLNGLELLKRIREVNKEFRVIIVTGDGSFKRLQQACGLGFSSYVTIPFNPDDLLRQVRMVLNRSGSAHVLGLESILCSNIDVSRARPVIKAVLKEVHARFNKRITLREISSSLRVSEEYVCRAFKEDCRMTPYAYIKRLKILTAMALLKNTDYSLTRISGATGFFDESHFVRAFKEMKGTSPMRFRQRFKEE